MVSMGNRVIDVRSGLTAYRIEGSRMVDPYTGLTAYRIWGADHRGLRIDGVPDSGRTRRGPSEGDDGVPSSGMGGTVECWVQAQSVKFKRVTSIVSFLRRGHAARQSVDADAVRSAPELSVRQRHP
jgi:hypothetical protein